MKLSLFERNNKSYSLFKINVNKEVKDAQYNNGLWVVALVAITYLGVTSISLGLFSQLFDKKKNKKEKKNKD